MKKEILSMLIAALPVVGALSEENGPVVRYLHVESDDRLESFEYTACDSLVVTGVLSVQAQQVLGQYCLHCPLSYDFSGCQVEGGEILESAFFDKEGKLDGHARYVVLPEGVTSIGARAFALNKDLKAVRLPQCLARYRADRTGPSPLHTDD